MIYDLPFQTANGQETTLAPYRGQVLLLVNVASRCGFTPQYTGLENLYKTYKDRGLMIVGFPCNQFLFQEPGNNDTIQQFCSVNYGVSFPVMGKLKVNGWGTHPLYVYLKRQYRGTLFTKCIKWNFTKFLVNRRGDVVGRFGPFTTPEQLAPEIEKLLNESAVVSSTVAV